MSINIASLPAVVNALPNEVRDSEETMRIVYTMPMLYSLARDMEVGNEAQVISATEVLGNIAKMKKTLEAQRNFLVRPRNEVVALINAAFKQITVPLDEATTTLKSKIKHYNDEIRAESVRHTLEDAVKQAQLAIASGSPQLPAVPEPKPIDTTVRTESATVYTRKTWKWKIVDFSKVPDDYKQVDSKAINEFISNTISLSPDIVPAIPGLVIFCDEEVGVRTR